MLSVLSRLSVGSMLLDKLLDVELSDEGLHNWVLEVDVGDLDLGFVGHKVHSSFSFLSHTVRNREYLPLLGV